MNYGRSVIYTDAPEITINNVVDEVRTAIMTHEANRADIQTLYDYYRGKTAILNKEKHVREEINHKICENRAYEVASFYDGYIFGNPIQYVRRETAPSGDADDEIAADINALNGYMADASKAACDKKLGTWMHVGGTAYRMVLPNPKWTRDGDEPPFKLYALDPRSTFVVKRRSVDETPIMGVHYVQKGHGEREFGVYTDKYYFEFSEFGKPIVVPNPLGMIPIIEYSRDASARLGAYEVAVSLLDALNELQSNRMDDIVQFVNSFLVIMGGQLEEETYQKLTEYKLLCLPEGTDAKYLSTSLNQTDIQTFKDDLYQAILTICGVPNRGNGGGSSDNGVAVYLRDGFSEIENRASTTETCFKESEKEFLKLILRILRDTTGTRLRLTDIETHFTRRNYENIASKSQVLISMLNNPKIHPELAFSSSGMFVDPESAYLQSMAYYEEQMQKWEPVEINEDEDDV